MIPVQDNWLHIDNNFIDSCEQINHKDFNNNFQAFKQLGLFKLLLPESMGGRNGHLQDLLECQIAISEHDVYLGQYFGKIASAPYLIKQFGEAVFDKIFGADNEALVLLYSGDLDTAISMEVDIEFDWIVVQNDDTYCLLNVVDRKILPEHTITLQELCDYNGVSWFQLYNRVLTTSCLGGLQHIINTAMNVSDKRLYAVLGTHLARLDEMKLCLHRNINHALLHIENNEQIPMYDRVKYKVQSKNVYDECCYIANQIVFFCQNLQWEYDYDNSIIRELQLKIKELDIEHLSMEDCDAVQYIEHLKNIPITDVYL